MSQHNKRTTHIPLDERDPATVRAAISPRSSETGATPEDMREQITQCREFIKAMGWPEVPPDRIFTEARSGVRNVERPMIDAVLKLAAQGEIDVIVAREWERVARVSARRHQIIMTAADFGTEYRFANLAATKGKMPDTLESRLISGVLEELGQLERDKIVERLAPARLRRYTDGLPHGGSGDGPLYGYLPGERRIGKHGKPAGVLTWVIDEPKATHVRDRARRSTRLRRSWASRRARSTYPYGAVSSSPSHMMTAPRWLTSRTTPWPQSM
jgi:DNA invertase Pin-like site-specific DNA recombinase